MLLQRIKISIINNCILKTSFNCRNIDFSFSQSQNFSRSQSHFKSINSIKHSSFSLKILFFNSYRSDETYINFDKDYYQILGVDQKAELHQIKQKFYILAKQYHPDKNKGQQSLFKEINEAYNILSQTKLRNQYDSNRNREQNPNEEAAFQNTTAKSGSLNYQPYSQMSRAQWAVYRNGFMSQSKVDYTNYKKTFDPQKNLQLGIKQAEQWNRAFRNLKKEQVEEEIEFRNKLYRKMREDMQQRLRAKQQFYDKKFERIGDRIQKIFGKRVRGIYNNLIKK